MITRILTLGAALLTLMATAHADPVSDCQEAMRVRPMGPAPGVPAWSPAAPIAALNARIAAVRLCESDPYAHLRPLPWETAAPVARAPMTCTDMGNGTVVCQ